MEGPPAKRARLSLACNECRRRKVKCDAHYPKCRNCRTRDIDCFTSDPKHPGHAVFREWIEPINSEVLEKPITKSPPVAEVESVISPLNTISPAHQPHEMFFSRDHASNRMKMMGGSSSACLTQSLNLYVRRAGIKSVSDHFRYGMPHAEEFHLPLEVSLPDLPDAEKRTCYVETYFRKIHRLWPITDVDGTKAVIHRLATVNKRTLQPDQIPLLATAYLILSLGADEYEQCPSSDGDLYLKGAASLLVHVLFIPYLSSVQALLLYVLAYRGRNKDGLGWQVIGMAIRIAQSLGLHRHSIARPAQDHGVTHKPEQLFHSRIWAICCCLEKLMQLESGRPSAIGGVNRDQMMGTEQRPPGLDYLQWNMGIAEIQEHISAHIYAHRPGDRTSRQILLDTARLDKALLDWTGQLPPEFHPANDLFCDDNDFHIAAFLSIQYHQTMIALHRAGLIATGNVFEAEVNKQCPEEPSRFRLKNAEAICVKSARAIARLTIELVDRKAKSRILTAGPPLLACVVLAIHLAKTPNGRMQAADLELLKACAGNVKEQFIESGQDERFANGVMIIVDAVQKYLKIIENGKPGTATTTGLKRTVGTRDQSALGTPTLHAYQPPPAYHDITPTDLVSSRRSHIFPDNESVVHSAYDLGSQTLVNEVAIGTSSSHIDFLETADQQKHQPDIFNQENFDIGPLPFDDYDVADLWNWMLLVDNTQSPHESISTNNHIAYI